MIEPREFLTRVFQAAVAAADPGRATRQAVVSLGDLTTSVVLLSAGKGAHAMASGAVAALAERGISVSGGLVVAHEPDPGTSHGLPGMEGDHPVPGRRSLAAADRLTATIAGAPADRDAVVLISGGATSLIAAPVEGITGDDLRGAFETLLASGADIMVMNLVRKRLLRFGAGRLALGLKSRRIHCLIASDVVGNHVASIASGPCVPDSHSSNAVRGLARAAKAWDSLPARVQSLINRMANGAVRDVPRPDHPRFASTTTNVILDRTHAANGAAAAARSEGVTAVVMDEPVAGEAAATGARIASYLLQPTTPIGQCIIWSGETTVTLGESSGRGGRCQELALSCAKSLAEAGESAAGITVLAAGTDGRDGPNDSAGAIVNSFTWSAISAAGSNPEVALRSHNSYDALDSVGALLKTGPTGTNVNDLILALRL